MKSIAPIPTNNENYRQQRSCRQLRMFSIIGTTMASLLLLSTLFWTGLVPFPFFNEFSGKTSSQSSVPCPPDNIKPEALKKIKARVFNASQENGLAKEVAEALQAKEVGIEEIGNWEGARFSDSVLLLTSKKYLAAAYTLRAFFPDANIRLDTENNLRTVDVVLGDNWTAMHKDPQPKDFQKATEPLPNCVKD